MDPKAALRVRGASQLQVQMQNCGLPVMVCLKKLLLVS